MWSWSTPPDSAIGSEERGPNSASEVAARFGGHVIPYDPCPIQHPSAPLITNPLEGYDPLSPRVIARIR